MATIFGTDGIREQYGQHWLSPRGTYTIGHAVAHWLQQHYTQDITIAIATDTRASRHALRASLYSALTLYPCTIIDYGVMPTSALVALLRQNDYTCGIMLTASHNGHSDNGIKIFERAGAKLSPDAEHAISDHAHNAYTDPNPFEQNSALQQKASFAHVYNASNGSTAYKQFLYHACFPDLSGITVALDTAAGATHYVAQDVFSACGAHVVIASPEPNGYTINHNCGSTKPHTLQQSVIDHHADIGFAFDGDGDRVIAVNKHGEIKDGDDILALLSHHPAYRHEPYVVGTEMSNMGLSTYFENNNKKLLRTKVGDKHVLRELYNRGIHLGGEPSGHIALTDLHTTGDGILTALRVLEVVQKDNNWDMHSFEKYTQITYTIPIQKRFDLNTAPLSDILTAGEQQINGRIHARYSGTEPVMRVMIESDNQEQAHTVGKQLYTDITQAIGRLCNEY